MAATSSDPATPPQRIPRPGLARAGGPAPWARIPAARRRGLHLDRVLGALEGAGQLGPVPGPDSEAVRPWVEVEPADTVGPSVGAAVLVPLFEEGGETRVVLTRRSTALRAHRGEVSFPGGRLDPGERAEAAALREADEEIALDPATVRVAGWLHPVLTFVSGSLILPVVGTLEWRPKVRPSPAEVDRVFDVALEDLVADGAFHEERWAVPGRAVPGSPDGTFPVWFFDGAGETIWGATARMLYELLSIVLGVPSAPG